MSLSPLKNWKNFARITLLGGTFLWWGVWEGIAAETADAPSEIKSGKATEAQIDDSTTASATATASTTESVLSQDSHPLLREGTHLVRVLGQFRRVGDKLLFFPKKGGRRLIGLENLGLQRIARVVRTQSKHRLWQITGLVTEFGGENYILIEHAVTEELAPEMAGRARGTRLVAE